MLKLHPAVMTVWLMRLAGEAYDGNFWENFTRLVGVEINAPARPEFVRVFRQCCFLAGITTLDPRFGMNSRWSAERIPMKGNMSFTADEDGPPDFPSALTQSKHRDIRTP